MNQTLQYKKKSFGTEKLFSLLWFKNYGFVVLGSLLVALGYVFFIVPHNLVPGGVFGFSIIINKLTGYPVGVIALCINIPLLLWGIKVLGGQFGVKTVLAMVLGSVFIDSLTYFIGDVTVTKDILVSALFGGGIIGFGVALVIKAEATTGGTDIVARILSKYLHVSMGKLFIFIDGSIVLFAIFVFRDFDLASYCIIAIIAISRTVDLVLNGLDNKKTAFIISEKHESIRKYILENDLGGTYIDGQGLFYTENQKKIIFTAVDRKDLTKIERYIKQVDAEAFIATMNTNDVFGNGFKPIE